VVAVLAASQHHEHSAWRGWMQGGHCLIIRFVLNLDDRAVAAGHSVDPSRWLAMLDELMLRVGARFRRVEPRRRARAFVLGLLAGLLRKNCWTIAVQAGEASPDGMQHLLERARWDADGMGDDVRDYVIEHLSDPGAVLVVDLCRSWNYAEAPAA
jgi:DDE superfamily endonuclease